MVGVVNAWNVFGGRVRNIFTPFVDALTTPDAPPVPRASADAP
jgi:hypothetical protein